ncbi:MAG: glycosyltransferase family 4 protein [Actinobacteria bacterium]|nr:glycosyltransferase family 4 protein [Actinomycetota bacterium]
MSDLFVTSALGADDARVTAHVLDFTRRFARSTGATLAVAVPDDDAAGRLVALLERQARAQHLELEADIALVPCATPDSLASLVRRASVVLDSGCDDLRRAAGERRLPLADSIETWVAARRPARETTVASAATISELVAASRSGCDLFTTTDPAAAAAALLVPGIRRVELVVQDDTAAVAAGADPLTPALDRIDAQRWAHRQALEECGVAPARFESLDEPPDEPQPAAERILDAVLATTYPINPPGNGGALRMHWLWREMPAGVGCTAFTLSPRQTTFTSTPVASARAGREITAPYRGGYLLATVMLGRALGATADDLAAALLLDDDSPFMRVLRRRAELPVDVVVSAHGFLTRQLRRAFPGTPLVYDSHNVETDLKASIYAGSRVEREALEHVRALEVETCAEAAAVICCTEEDRRSLVDLYGADPARTHVVANGAPVTHVPFTAWERRATRHRSCVFSGNAHRPNVDAVEAIVRAAERLPDVDFHVIGSVCSSIESAPANVRLHGFLPEDAKQELYATSTLALNPMASGSGSNLKVVDYAAAGLPVVTTAFGARGFDADLVAEFALCERQDELAEAIVAAFAEDWTDRTGSARRICEERYDWAVLAKAYAAILAAAA